LRIEKEKKKLFQIKHLSNRFDKFLSLVLASCFVREEFCIIITLSPVLEAKERRPVRRRKVTGLEDSEEKQERTRENIVFSFFDVGVVGWLVGWLVGGEEVVL